MLLALSIGMLVAGLLGTGLFNVIGTPGTKNDLAGLL
jgi:hypothetical protein